MQTVTLPNGQQANFPDGMSADDMSAAIQRSFPELAPQPPQSTMSDLAQAIPSAGVEAGSSLERAALTVGGVASHYVANNPLVDPVGYAARKLGLEMDPSEPMDNFIVQKIAEDDARRDANPTYQPTTTLGKAASAIVRNAPAIAASFAAPEATPIIFGSQGAMEGGMGAIDAGQSLENAQLKSAGQGTLNALAGELFTGAAAVPGVGKLFAPLAADTAGNVAARIAQGAGTMAALKPAGTAVDYLADKATGEAPPPDGYDWMPSAADLIAGGAMALPHSAAEYIARNNLPAAPMRLADGSDVLAHSNGTLFSSPETANDFVRSNNLDNAAPVPVTARMFDPNASSDDLLGYAVQHGVKPPEPSIDPDPAGKVVADITAAPDVDSAIQAATSAVGDVLPGETLEQTLDRISKPAPAPVEDAQAVHIATLEALRDQTPDSANKDRLQAVIDNLQPPAPEDAVPAAEPATSVPAAVDRRQDIDTRKAVAEMSPDELRQALLTSDLTGIPNKRAFAEDRAANPDSHVMYGDVDDLKMLNSRYGHEGADQILTAVGKAQAEVGDALNVSPFHRSGDEFLATHPDPATLGSYGKAVQDRLANATVTIKMPDGNVVEHKGIGFSYGTGRNADAAEAAADSQKVERKRLGLRTGARDASPAPEQQPRSESPQSDAAPNEAPRGAEVSRYSSRVTNADGSYRNGTGLDEFNARQFSNALNRAKPGVDHIPEARDNGRFDVVGYEKPGSAQSVTERAPPAGLSKESLDLALSKQRAAWQGFRDVNTYKTLADVPAALRERVGADEHTDGFYDGATHSVHLIADKIPTPERAQWVAAHEVDVHAGLRALRDPDINEALNLARGNKFIRTLAESIATERGMKMTDPDQRNIAHEEALAELGAAMQTDRFDGIMRRYGVEVPETLRGGVMASVQRVFDAIRRYLGKVLGRPVADVPDAAVRSLLMDAHQAVRNPGAMGTGPGATMFSQAERKPLSFSEQETPPSRSTFEVAPDPRNTELKSRWDALPPAAKTSISREVAQTIVPRVLESFHDPRMQGSVHEQLGGWQDDTNPSLSVWYRHDAPADKVDAATRMLGSALNQEAMMRTSPESFIGSNGEPVNPSGAIVVDVPRGTDIASLYTKIRSIVDPDGVPYVNGHTSTDSQMVMIHGDEGRISTDDLARRVADTVDEPYQVHTDQIYVDFPEKGDDDYGLSRVQEGGDQLGSSLRTQSDQLRAEANARLGELIERAEGTDHADATQAGSERSGSEPVGRERGLANEPESEQSGRLSKQLPGYSAYEGVEREEKPRVTGFVDSLAKLFQPGGREEAKETAGIIRANLGQQAREREVAQEHLMDFAKQFNKMPVADNYAFIDAMEHGKPLADPVLDRAARALRKVLDERRDQVIALGKGALENFNVNYFPHIWQDPGKVSTFFSRRPLEGGKGFLKQRTYPFFMDGIKAGLEPITTNPVELALIKAREMDRYIYGQKIFSEMKDAGIAKFVRFGDKAPDGWVKINDNIARVLQYSDEAKGMVIRGEYYAPEPAATVLNNHLSPGLSGVAAYDVLRKAGNVMNSAQLGLSAFHLGFTTLDASISKAALGIKQAARGDVLKGVTNIAQSLNPLQPLMNVMKGDRLMQAYLGKLQDPDMAPIVDAIQQAGGRAKQDEVYSNQGINEFRQAIKKGNYGTAARKVLPVLGDLINKPIFEYLVPRQKLGVFFDLAQDALNHNPGMDLATKREVMGKLWDSVDNRMGQLVYDNVFWNRTLKDALMVSTRSVGWNLGTIREIGGGIKDLKDVGKLGGLSDRSSYVLGMTFITGILGSMLQYLYTGKGPDETKDMFFPRTGKIRPDGTEDRISLPSYMKDIAEYGHDIRGFVKYGDNPLNTVMNKIHPLLSTVGDLISNKDFFGGAIRSPGDSAGQQAKDVGKFMIKQVMPFSLRNYQQQSQASGEPESIGGYLSSPSMIGLSPAPGYITKTDAETESAAVNRMHDALVSKFREEMRDGADWNEINERARAAGLSPQDRTWIRKSAAQHPPKRLKAFGNP